MDEKYFQRKYGDIYDGLVLSGDRSKRMSSLFQPFWFVTRRLIFSCICIFAEHELWLQITVALACSLINAAHLFKYQPFEDRKILKLEMMNEMTNLFLLYHVICFSGLVLEAEDRFNLGWSFIMLVGANMSVHLLLLVV